MKTSKLYLTNLVGFVLLILTMILNGYLGNYALAIISAFISIALWIAFLYLKMLLSEQLRDEEVHKKNRMHRAQTLKDIYIFKKTYNMRSAYLKGAEYEADTRNIADFAILDPEELIMVLDHAHTHEKNGLRLFRKIS